MDIRERLTQIKTLDDVDIQLKRAKNYAKNLHKQSKNDALPLVEKIALGEQAKLADKTLRNLRQLSFDVDDALNANKTAISVLD
jgi:DNA-binding transcriptional MerR regulator